MLEAPDHGASVTLCVTQIKTPNVLALTGRRRATRDGYQAALLLGAPVERLVYARHGHELMG